MNARHARLLLFYLLKVSSRQQVIEDYPLATRQCPIQLLPTRQHHQHLNGLPISATAPNTPDVVPMQRLPAKPHRFPIFQPQRQARVCFQPR